MQQTQFCFIAYFVVLLISFEQVDCFLEDIFILHKSHMIDIQLIITNNLLQTQMGKSLLA